MVDSITLTKEAPLECSKNNKRYILVLGFYLGQLEILSSIADCELAKASFSQTIIKHMPEHKGLINDIDYAQLLNGEFATNLEYVYEAMLGLWMDIQDELLSDSVEIDCNEFSSRILDIYSAVMNLYISATS
jgi:hypothetical protein